MTTMIDAPARPCDQGRRDAWRRTHRGGWICARCVMAPAAPVDDFGLPLLVARHVCDKNGCTLAADEAGDPGPVAPFVAVAQISARGPLLLCCPGCRRWARVILVDAAGALACAACAES